MGFAWTLRFAVFFLGTCVFIKGSAVPEKDSTSLRRSYIRKQYEICRKRLHQPISYIQQIQNNSCCMVTNAIHCYEELKTELEMMNELNYTVHDDITSEMMKLQAVRCGRPLNDSEINDLKCLNQPYLDNCQQLRRREKCGKKLRPFDGELAECTRLLSMNLIDKGIFDRDCHRQVCGGIDNEERWTFQGNDYIIFLRPLDIEYANMYCAYRNGGASSLAESINGAHAAVDAFKELLKNRGLACKNGTSIWVGNSDSYRKGRVAFKGNAWWHSTQQPDSEEHPFICRSATEAVMPGREPHINFRILQAMSSFRQAEHLSEYTKCFNLLHVQSRNDSCCQVVTALHCAEKLKIVLEAKNELNYTMHDDITSGMVELQAGRCRSRRFSDSEYNGLQCLNQPHSDNCSELLRQKKCGMKLKPFDGELAECTRNETMKAISEGMDRNNCG